MIHFPQPLQEKTTPCRYTIQGASVMIYRDSEAVFLRLRAHAVALPRALQKAGRQLQTLSRGSGS